MRNILFVDDEKKVLSGLERTLYSQRDEWTMFFVTSGKEALEKLEKEQFDVIVSDMQMPHMDGPTLLQEVVEKHPNVVRIVLSAYTEFEATLQSVQIAHHFLVKPCDKDTLIETIERSCVLQSLIKDTNLRDTVAQIKELPSVPRIYQQVCRMLADKNCSINELAQVVEQDPAFCAKIYKIVQSAFFGLNKTIDNMQQAITYLGVNMIKSLILTTSVFDSFAKFKGFSIDDWQKHSIMVASIARKMVSSRYDRDNAYLAGVMHDIGKLVLLNQFKEQFGELYVNKEKSDKPMYKKEYEIGDFSHSEIGAYLLSSWGIPYPVVEAIAFHHRPQKTAPKTFDTLSAVYVANLLVHENTKEEDRPTTDEIDETFLKHLKVGNRLDEWRKITKEIMMDA